MVLQIPQQIIDALIAQAKSELPNEACGLLAGKGDIVVERYPLTNIDHSPEHFSFDPKEQFAALRQARAKGLQIIANYHSHPSSPARPSQEDIRLAYDPNILYLILSLQDPAAPSLKAFAIKDGKVEEIAIGII
ncbi:MAG: M67 family metallopeptidase [Candidatus Symbiothrix sp.]|jgi:proteasome lid subunit RPN8/RPN11|nr:M67 family metallopeptidase [Candidatus Symbiothrix sp.]